MDSQENKTRIHALLREVASLTASLQREAQRRASISAIAKEQELLISDTQQKLRQVQYANRKLEEEVQALKARNPGLDSATTRTQTTPSNAALQQEVERLHQAVAAMQNTNNNDNVALSQQQKTSGEGVESAVQELEAIVPRHRATITALQSRLAVTNSQLEEAIRQKDELHKELKASREEAQQRRTAFAEASAKLHSQEAAMLSEASARASVVSKLETESSTWRERCKAAEAAAEEAQIQAHRAQRELEATTKLAVTQTETIRQLEETVREQQDDIIAALDLVCHHNRSSPAPLFSASSSKHNINSKVADIENDDAAWTIPAGGGGSGGGSGSGGAIGVAGKGSLSATTAVTKQQGFGAVTSPAKRGLAAASPSDQGNGSMTQLASDIAALQRALREVM